jgi:hypothetical protein
MTRLSHFRASIPQLGPDVDGYVLDELDGHQDNHPACVLSQRGCASALGYKNGSALAMIRTITGSRTGSRMDSKLRKKIDNPIVFNYIGPGSKSGLIIHGFETGTFIEILKFLMDMRREKVLLDNQLFLAERAEQMLLSLANTTLDSIVYQESGFWKVVEGQRVAEILDKFLQANARTWAKTFPDEFWVKLIRVKGIPGYYALKRPAFVGHWVNDIVYDRIAPGFRKKLNELNPRLPAGYRKNKNHQHTTADYGLPELKAHLIKVMAYMDAAANDTQFMRMLNRGTPRFGDTYELPLDDVYH